MTSASKDKPGKPSAAPDEKEKVKKPVVPKLPAGTKIGKGGGGIRTSVEVPILPKDTKLSPGGGPIRPAARDIKGNE